MCDKCYSTGDRTQNKLLIIFNMNGFCVHGLHKISLENNKSLGDLNIVANTKKYFICLRFIKFHNECLGFFEVSLWTSSQEKNAKVFFPFLFTKK